MARINIPIPANTFPTRIELYVDGELNRSGGVQPGAITASVKIPNGYDIDDCDIRVLPCDQTGKVVGRGHVFVRGELLPAPLEDSCKEDSCKEDSCEEDSCETSEIQPESTVEVSISRPEVDEDTSDDSSDLDVEEDVELRDDTVNEVIIDEIDEDSRF